MKKKLLFFTALTLLLATACNNDDSIDNKIDNRPNEKAILGVNAKMDISQTTSTRELIDEPFKSGDILGVFIDDADATTTYDPKAFSKFTYDGSAWAVGDTKQYLASTVADVYSFFPIQTVANNNNTESPEAAVDIVPIYADKTIPVKIVSTFNNFLTTGQTDYLYGTDRTGTGAVEDPYLYTTLPKASNAAEDAADPDPVAYDPNVDIYLHHALAKVSFVVNKGENYSGEGKITKIELFAHNSEDPVVAQNLFFKGEGNMSLEASPTNRFTNLTAASSLVMEYTEGVIANAYNATPSTEIKAKLLMAPVTTAIETPNKITLKITIDGKEMSKVLTLSADKTFESGKNYGYTITVTPTQLNISTVKLVGWADETVAPIEVS